MDYEKLTHTLDAHGIETPDELQETLQKLAPALPTTQGDVPSGTRAQEAQDCFNAVLLLVAAAHAHNADASAPSARIGEACDAYAKAANAHFSLCFNTDAPASQRWPAWNEMYEASKVLSAALSGNSKAIDATDAERTLLDIAHRLGAYLPQIVRVEERNIKPELTVHAGGKEAGQRPFPSELKELPASIARVWKGASPLPLNRCTIDFLKDYDFYFPDASPIPHAPRRDDMAHVQFNEAVDRIHTAKELLTVVCSGYFSTHTHNKEARDKLLKLDDMLHASENVLVNIGRPLIMTPHVLNKTMDEARAKIDRHASRDEVVLSKETIALKDSDCGRDALWGAVQNDIADTLEAVHNSLSLESLNLPRDTGPYHVITIGQTIQLTHAALEQAQRALGLSGPAISRGEQAQGRS